MDETCLGASIKMLNVEVRNYNMLQRFLANDASWSEINDPNFDFKIRDLLPLIYHTREQIMIMRYVNNELMLQSILDGLDRLNCLPSDLPLSIDVRTIEKRLTWLAYSQAENYSWFNDVDITTAGLLAFIRQGNAHKRYNIDIEGCFNWLLEHRKSVQDPLLNEAIDCVIAEYHGREVPITTYNVSKEQQRASELFTLRQIAIANGKAIKYGGTSASRRAVLGPLYTKVEIAWMAVCSPTK